MPDADARGNADTKGFRARRRVDREESLGEVGAVVTAGDAQSQRQLSGAVGQILDAARARPAPPHPWDSLQWFQSADQDASGAALRLGDHVEAFVHAVDEVDVGVSGFTE